jgi:enoyl-CoA hydratase
MEPESELLTERLGRAGAITLNRPKALNALTLGMVHGIADALKTYGADPEVAHVVIRQAGERAFCAGGDIRAQHDAGRAGKYEQMAAFYRDEYRMNRMIKRFSKPYLALIDGIVMGGGAGVSVHGTYRVGTERLLFAMPEVGIGFFPDVGGTYFLPRLPGQVGLYLALSGKRIGVADALWSGLVTHHVPSADLPRLLDALAKASDPLPVLNDFARDPGPSALAQQAPEIDALFDGSQLSDVLASLGAAAARGSAFADEVAAAIRTRSPTSVAVTFRQVRQGASLSFEDCMRLELRIAEHMIRGHDFYEGVRAVILDKDNAPRWNPATIEALSGDEIDRYFQPTPDSERLFE